MSLSLVGREGEDQEQRHHGKKVGISSVLFNYDELFL